MTADLKPEVAGLAKHLRQFIVSWDGQHVADAANEVALAQAAIEFIDAARAEGLRSPSGGEAAEEGFIPERVTGGCADAGPARLSPEEIADYHARFISCNSGFAAPKELIKSVPHVDTPILFSHGSDKAFDMLLERLREPWEKMKGVAAKKINRLLADRREADAAIALLRKELAEAERKVRSCAAAYESLVAEDTNFAQMVRDTFAEYGLFSLPSRGAK